MGRVRLGSRNSIKQGESRRFSRTREEIRPSKGEKKRKGRRMWSEIVAEMREVDRWGW